MALLPMEELLLARPDLNKVMALMPNMEDLEELLIKRLDCGGRGTVGAWKSTFFSICKSRCWAQPCALGGAE